jgi:hypothetical protein
MSSRPSSPHQDDVGLGMLVAGSGTTKRMREEHSDELKEQADNKDNDNKTHNNVNTASDNANTNPSNKNATNKSNNNNATANTSTNTINTAAKRTALPKPEGRLIGAIGEHYVREMLVKHGPMLTIPEVQQHGLDADYDKFYPCLLFVIVVDVASSFICLDVVCCLLLLLVLRVLSFV